MRLIFIIGLMVVTGGYAAWTAEKAVDQVQRTEPRVKETLVQSFRNSIGIEFVLIPEGEFMMGSTIGDDEHPVHPVRIIQPFYMSKYEVTQSQWKTIMGTTIQEQRNKANPQWRILGVGDDLPIYYVNWDEAQEFMKRLNAFENVDTYRLPTEAEWEYACRAGTTGEYAGEVDAMAWYGPNSNERPHPVGQKQPNAWGLFDMTGNVWEWCSDWYGPYTNIPLTDPQGPSSGTTRIVRGGSWLIDRDGCRSADRVSGNPSSRNSSTGFRIVMSVK